MNKDMRQQNKSWELKMMKVVHLSACPTLPICSWIISNTNHFSAAGHIIYQELDIDNHMYFIDSGTVLVETQDRLIALRSQGNFFGEVALLHPKQIQSDTVIYKTPIHTLGISCKYFEKCISSSERGMFLTLKEKDKIHK
jgi:CRP-like cAMP-binding protein